MARSIEAVIADAQERLERNGKLDVEAYVTSYPEYALELRRLLPTLLTVHRERRIKTLEEETFAFAVGLFTADPIVPKEPAAGTVGALLSEELERTGQSIQSYAEVKGLSQDAVRAMTRDQTPLSEVVSSGSVIKQLAQRWAAPFNIIVVELRRLISMDAARDGTPQMLFTRDKETSTAEEHRSLMQRVFEATSRPQRPPEGGPKKP